MQIIGQLLHDPIKVAYGKVKLGFIQLSSGMFKETFESLKTINAKILPDSIKKEYYFLRARTYYDLADFDSDDYYSPIYNAKAAIYIDSATTLCNSNSFDFIYYKGLRDLKTGNKIQSILNLKSLINTYKLSNHEFAITASTLSDIYVKSNQPDSAISLLILAAIADVRSSTKETAAILNLAQLLQKRGEIKSAYYYIKQAMDDALFYGARQRKMQIGAILPVIAGERIDYVEEQKQALFLYSSLLTLLSILVVLFAIISYKQLQKLKIADKLIMAANQNLQKINTSLIEATTIKEEYIGYYFNLISEYINKLDKFKRSVDNKLTSKKYEDIRVLISNINLAKEREELFLNFDKAGCQLARILFELQPAMISFFN